jgi:hypothetical protein
MAVAPFLDFRARADASSAAPQLAAGKLAPLRSIPDLDDVTFDVTASTLGLIFDIPGEVGPIAVVLTPAELDGDLEGALARQLPPTEHVADALRVIRECWLKLVADLSEAMRSGAFEVLGQPDSLFADYKLIPTRLLRYFVEHDFHRGSLRSLDGDRIEGVVVRLAPQSMMPPTGGDDKSEVDQVKSLLATVAKLRSNADLLAWLIETYKGKRLPDGDQALRRLHDANAVAIAKYHGGSPKLAPERSFRTARRLYEAAVQHHIVAQVDEILARRR